MNTTPSLPPTTPFEEFRRGDRIRFITWRRYVGGFRHGMVWRTGTVQLATDRALTVECDTPNPIGRRAVIRREGWEQRCPQKLYIPPNPLHPFPHHSASKIFPPTPPRRLPHAPASATL